MRREPIYIEWGGNSILVKPRMMSKYNRSNKETCSHAKTNLSTQLRDKEEWQNPIHGGLRQHCRIIETQKTSKRNLPNMYTCIKQARQTTNLAMIQTQEIS